MRVCIKDMTEAEMDGKAYVHWKSWQETYRGLVPDRYLDEKITLERCRSIAYKWPQTSSKKEWTAEIHRQSIFAYSILHFAFRILHLLDLRMALCNDLKSVGRDVDGQLDVLVGQLVEHDDLIKSV